MPRADRIETIARDGYDSRGAHEVEATRSNIKYPHARHVPCTFPNTHQPSLTEAIRRHIPHSPPHPLDIVRQKTQARRRTSR